jgi:hypothetical protein
MCGMLSKQVQLRTGGRGEISTGFGNKLGLCYYTFINSKLGDGMIIIFKLGCIFPRVL